MTSMTFPSNNRITDAPSNWKQYPNAIRRVAWESVLRAVGVEEERNVAFQALCSVLFGRFSCRLAAEHFDVNTTVVQRLFSRAYGRIMHILQEIEEADLTDAILMGNEPIVRLPPTNAKKILMTIPIEVPKSNPDVKEEPPDEDEDIKPEISHMTPSTSSPNVVNFRTSASVNIVASRPITLNPLKKKFGVDSIVDRLAQKKANESSGSGSPVEAKVKAEEEEPPKPTASPPRVGSNKRKPKLVSKFVQDEEDEDDLIIKDIDDFQILLNVELDETQTNSNDYSLALDQSIRTVNLPDKERQHLRTAVGEVLGKSLSIREAHKVHGFSMQMITSYVNKTRKKFKEIVIKNGRLTDPQMLALLSDKKEYAVGPPLDPDDEERINLIESVCTKVVKASMYPRQQKERLRKGILMVVSGEYTINAAANMLNLPSSTVHPYVHKARLELGQALPPQASGPTVLGGKLRPNIHARIARLFTSADEPSSSNAVKKEEEEETKEDDGTFNIEKLDKVVTDLVQGSHYDDLGKQKLFEATLLVLTENISVVEASKQHGLPASTVQPYVAKARMALGMSVGGQSSQASVTQRPPAAVPKVFSAPKRTTASEEEVKTVVEKSLQPLLIDCDRWEKMYRVVLSAVLGKMTIKDACEMEGVSSSTAHPYVVRARHILGDRCPPSKTVSTLTSINPLSGKIDMMLARKAAAAAAHAKSTEKVVTHALSLVEPLTREEETTTIGDILVPNSMRAISRLVKEKKIGEEHRTDFAGTKEELRKIFDDILTKFNYKGGNESMVEAMTSVLVQSKTNTEACAMFDLAPTTLSAYIRLIKTFYRTESMDVYDEPPSPPQPGVKKVLIIRKVPSKTNPFVVVKTKALTPKAETEENEEQGEPSPKRPRTVMNKVELLVTGDQVIDMAFSCHGAPLYRVLAQYIISSVYENDPERQEALFTLFSSGLSKDTLDVDVSQMIDLSRIQHSDMLSSDIIKDIFLLLSDAYKCIVSECDQFVSDARRMINLCKLPNPSCEGRNESKSPIRASSRIQARKEKESEAGEFRQATVEFLNALFTDTFNRPMISFLRRLRDVHLPVDHHMLAAMGKMVYEFLPEKNKVNGGVTESEWRQWARKAREYNEESLE